MLIKVIIQSDFSSFNRSVVSASSSLTSYIVLFTYFSFVLFAVHIYIERSVTYS